MNFVHNERTKLTATWLNSVAAVVDTGKSHSERGQPSFVDLVTSA